MTTKLIFEVRRVQVHGKGWDVMLAAVSERILQPYGDLCRIEIHVCDEEEKRQWLSRLGKQVSLVLEDA